MGSRLCATSKATAWSQVASASPSNGHPGPWSSLGHSTAGIWSSPVRISCRLGSLLRRSLKEPLAAFFKLMGSNRTSFLPSISGTATEVSPIARKLTEMAQIHQVLICPLSLCFGLCRWFPPEEVLASFWALRFLPFGPL